MHVVKSPSPGGLLLTARFQSTSNCPVPIHLERTPIRVLERLDTNVTKRVPNNELRKGRLLEGFRTELAGFDAGIEGLQAVLSEGQVALPAHLETLLTDYLADFRHLRSVR